MLGSSRASASWLTLLVSLAAGPLSCVSGSDQGSGGFGGGGPTAGLGGVSAGSGGGSRGTGGAASGTGGATAPPGDASAAKDAADGGTSGGDASFGACDPLTNAGCSGSMKCTALQSGTALALGCGSKGTKTIGTACSPTLTSSMQTGDDCAAGLACFSAQGESGATCHQICAGTGAGVPACPSPMMCSLKITGLTTVAFCQMTSACSPLAQAPCLSTQGCYLTPSGAMCALAGTTKPGDACSGANDCARGSTCVLTNGVGRCAFFCSTAGGAPMCAATGTGGATCTAMSGTPAEPNLGICQ